MRERDINLALWRKASHKCPGIDYDEISLVKDATTLHYLVSLVVFQRTDYAAYECGHIISLWGSRYGD